MTLTHRFFAIFLFFPVLGSAATFSSVGPGDWSDDATWSGSGTPTAGDTVNVDHDVRVDTTGLLSGPLNVRSGGLLRFSHAADSALLLVGGDLTIQSGGALQLGTDAAPLPDTVTATLTLALGAPGNNPQYRLLVQNGGAFSVRGNAKTPFAPATQGLSAGGAAQVRVSALVEGWRVGDRLLLSKSSTGGSHEVRVIVSSSVSGSELVLGLNAPPTHDHPVSAAFFVGNLTRNAVIRSSGTVVFGVGTVNNAYIQIESAGAADVRLAHGEFDRIGGGGGFEARAGLGVSGTNARVTISSCAVHDGYYGISLSGSENSLIENNVIHSDAYLGGYGVYSDGLVSAIPTRGRNVIRGNLVSGYGAGVTLWGSVGNVLEGNKFVGDERGVFFVSSARDNFVSGNVMAYNGGDGGLRFDPGLRNILVENDLFGNVSGVSLRGASDGNIFIGNDIHDNTNLGVSLAGSNGMYIANAVYANAGGGVYVVENQNTLFADGRIGYDAAGSLKPNIGFVGSMFTDNAANISMTLRGMRINTPFGTEGMNRAGNSIVTVNALGDPSSVRVWGDRRVSAETFSLESAQRLYAATATTPFQTKGPSPSSHSVTALTPVDAAAVSQSISVFYRGGQWWVQGSLTETLETVTPGTPKNYPATNPQVAFTLNQGSSVSEEDRVCFALLAASADAGTAKTLYMESAHSSFNGGRARLTVAPDGALVLRGTSSLPVEVKSAGSAFYNIISSGSLTVERALFQNMDSPGLEISGSAGVSLASTTFNDLSLTTGDNAYITARNLTSAATFYGLTFGASQTAPTTGQNFYNIRVTGTDAGLDWTLQGWSGAYAGAPRENDPNGRIFWPLQPPAGAAAAPGVAQIQLTWSHPTTPPAALRGDYRVRASSTSLVGPWTVDITTPTAPVLLPGLLDDTVYYLRVETQDLAGTPPAAAELTARTPDTVAPDAVTISADPGAAEGEVLLTWTSLGDNGGTKVLGTGSAFAVQYSTLSTGLVSWSTASAVIVSTSGVSASQNMSLTIPGLEISYAHVFRLWTRDGDGNWSAPSPNTPSTLPRLNGVAAVLTPSSGNTLRPLSRGDSFLLQFSRTMDPADVLPAVRLRRMMDNLGTSRDEDVPFTLSPGVPSTVFTVSPTAAMGGNSLYELTVSTAAEDAQGNHLPAAVSAQYTTVLNRAERNVLLAGSARIDVPAEALAADGSIGSQNVASGALALATEKLARSTEDPFRQLSGQALSLTVYDDVGAAASGVFGAPVTLSLPYTDANDDGIIDGTSPPVKAKTLAVYWLDERNNLWVKRPSQVDLANKRVSAQTPHFSTFALLGQADTDLSSAHPFPVPFTPTAGRTVITFTGLPQVSRVRIFTPEGALLKETQVPEGAGQWDWDVKDADGDPVPSGVYLYEITGGDNKKRGKLAVLR